MLSQNFLLWSQHSSELELWNNLIKVAHSIEDCFTIRSIPDRPIGEGAERPPGGWLASIGMLHNKQLVVISSILDQILGYANMMVSATNWKRGLYLEYIPISRALCQEFARWLRWQMLCSACRFLSIVMNYMILDSAHSALHPLLEDLRRSLQKAILEVHWCMP